MLFLRQRLTNKEIAGALGVENRRDAVVQADIMGLASGGSR